MPTLVHLVYIHGFQGDDTTFQSFPKNLQEHLAARIPEHLDITIQSSLYPTYKSVKPISYATKNFLEWLSTQPPGHVILLGHSMGGLLAADAATDPSNNPDRRPGGRPKRIVGVVAFDTPYLGMHPHVVISGIASLLPKGEKEEKETNTEGAMNVHPQVNVVDEKVTDDWEAFKKHTHVRPRNAPYGSDSGSSFFSYNSADASTLALTSTSSTPSLAPTPSTFVDRALTFVAARNDDPLVRWLRKHADDPIAAGKRWVTERFQFGICMFDPAGLKSRYSRFVQWDEEGGLWVNYWTTTMSHAGGSQITSQLAIEATDNDEALRTNGILDSSPPPYSAAEVSSPQPDTKAAQKELAKQLKQQEKHLKREEKAKAKALKQEENSKKPKHERHFVVLPNGLGSVLGGMDKWENVPIAGAQDEVIAHTGLFMPLQNLDYEGLVGKVANRIFDWCARIQKTESGR